MAAGANKEDDKFAIHSSFYIAKKLEEERVEEERVVLWPYRPFFFRCHREAMMVSRLHR